MANKNSLKLAGIGGGTGLSTLLRGLAQREGYEIIDMDRLTGIVSVSDDGGSSGRLRDEFNILPPGDIRNCLVALSKKAEMRQLFEYRFDGNGGTTLAGHSLRDLVRMALPHLLPKVIQEFSRIDEEEMRQLFEHRFDGNGGTLAGHSLGNLVLLALTQLSGSFLKAIIEAERMLAVRGRILPATLDNTTLCAELAEDEVKDELQSNSLSEGIIRGESSIPRHASQRRIKRVFLEPRNNGKRKKAVPPPVFQCKALDEAVSAIQKADAIIIGPGSLYTSIMPSLVIPGIAAALRDSRALRIYVCNLMAEPETNGYTVADHVHAIRNHADFHFDYVVANRRIIPEDTLKQYAKARMAEIAQDSKAIGDVGNIQVVYNPEMDHLDDDVTVIEDDFICEEDLDSQGMHKRSLRHDPEKLARALVKLLTLHAKPNNEDEEGEREMWDAQKIGTSQRFIFNQPRVCGNCRFWRGRYDEVRFCRHGSKLKKSNLAGEPTYRLHACPLWQRRNGQLYGVFERREKNEFFAQNGWD